MIDLRPSAVLVLLALSTGTASADTYNWFDFSDPSKLSINGDARVVGKKSIRLTESDDDERGSVFTRFGVTATGFHTTFSFLIKDGGGSKKDCRGNTGGEGLAFVLQGSAPTALGVGGSGIGYEGIPDSFAVEFDTYCDDDRRDLSTNHIALVSGGVELVSVPLGRDLKDGKTRYVWLDYDGQRLEVRLNGTEKRPQDPDLGFNVDIPAMVGGSVCCAGFTAATGSSVTATHKIFSWQYQEDSDAGAPASRTTFQPDYVQPVCRGRVGTSLQPR